MRFRPVGAVRNQVSGGADAKGPSRAHALKGGKAREHRTDRARRRNLKRAKPLRLKRMFAGFVVFLFLFELLPLGASDVPDAPTPSSLYGVNDELAAFQTEKESRYNSPDVLRETRGVLDLVQPRELEKTGPAIDYKIMDPSIPARDMPGIFDKAQNNTDLNGTSILQFLLGQPLAYWVYTNYKGCETWSKGLLRPSIQFTVDATGGVHLVDWERWVEVNADSNMSTGDGGGNEVRARISTVIENTSFDPPRLISVIPPQMSNWSFNFTGGIRLEVQRLTNTTARVPMEVAFLKSFMYRGYNYIWMVNFNYTNVPTTFEAVVAADKVSAGGNVRELIMNAIQNFSLGNSSFLSQIMGPYSVIIHTSPLSSLGATLGYAKAVNLELVERVWVNANFTPGAGLSDIPTDIKIWLDSPSYERTFDHVRWYSDVRCRLDFSFWVNTENITHATLQVYEMPTYLDLSLQNNSAEGVPNNSLKFQSSSSIGYFEYNGWEIYNESTNLFKHVHVLIKELPTSIEMSGTFEVAGAAVPPINNEIGIGFVARMLDNVMVRLASKFYTLARTLRSIPENVLRMPERDGWVNLDFPGGQKIGTIEVWLASGRFLMRDDSFFSFYNLTLPSTTAPLMNVSFSLRLKGLAGVHGDFRKGTHLEVRTAERQRFTGIFIDDNSHSNASLEIFPLPSAIILDVDEATRTMELSTTDKVLSITYIGYVKEQYMKVTLEDLPTSIRLVQKANSFAVDVAPDQNMGRIEILATDSRLYGLTGNYMCVKSGAWGTSLGAAFTGLTHVAYSTGAAGKLELNLTSQIPLAIYIDNETEMLRARLYINPFPRSISMSMGELFGAGLKVPDLMGATSVLGFSSAVFGITALGADVLGIAGRIAGMIDDQMTAVGRNSTLSVKTDGNTILVGDIQKGNVTEAPWTHGICSRQLSVPAKNTTYFNTKIFLRLPGETTLSSRSEGDIMNFSLEMKDFKPRYDWMIVDLKGIAGRDIFTYLTGMGTPTDLSMKVNITQNATYGREVIKADMDLHASKPMGPFLAMIGRPAPTNTRFLAFGSRLPSELKLTGTMADKVDVKYSASEELGYLYIKNSRLVSDRKADIWRSTTVLLHDIARNLEVSVNPPTGFSTASTPVQILPEFSVSADRDTLDVYVDLDGKATGSRTSYQLEVKDAGKLTTGRHSGDYYKVRSTGAESVYVRVRDMPYQKGLRITALGLMVEDIRSLDMTVTMVFDSYPMFKFSSLEAESVHLAITAKLSIGNMEKNARLVLMDYRSKDGVPQGIQMFTNGLSLGATKGEEHTLVPLPLATVIGTVLGG
jgi:hypothetical protein